ncbi:hypothetical protein [Gracilimonas sp.]|nr:hypothetical protein [Gracilimonas sp.]
MKDRIGDEARLKHILDSIEEIETYITEETFDGFSAHSMEKLQTI